MKLNSAGEGKFLEELRKLHEENVRLLLNKKWCEKTLCGEFLTRIGLEFEEREIIPVVPQNAEPPDIKFRSANFEIMYITGERKPDKETKDRLRQVKKANSIEDTFIIYESPKKISLAYMIEIVAQGLKKKQFKYDPNTISNLDALVFVRLHQFPDIDSSLPNDLNGIISQGWRSISVVISEYGIVLYANSLAPDFLKRIERKLIQKASMEWWYPKIIP